MRLCCGHQLHWKKETLKRDIAFFGTSNWEWQNVMLELSDQMVIWGNLVGCQYGSTNIYLGAKVEYSEVINTRCK